MLNTLSVETMRSTLGATRHLMVDVNPGLRLAGVVGTMTFADNLINPEKDSRALVAEALEAWQLDRHIFKRNIPRRNAISNNAGSQIAYIADSGIRDLFDELGDELCERIGL